MRMTSKGQVTIPIEIRTQLGLEPESEVEFEVVGNVVEMRKAPGGGRGRRVMERLLEARYSGPSNGAHTGRRVRTS